MYVSLQKRMNSLSEKLLILREQGFPLVFTALCIWWEISLPWTFNLVNVWARSRKEKKMPRETNFFPTTGKLILELRGISFEIWNSSWLGCDSDITLGYLLPLIYRKHEAFTFTLNWITCKLSNSIACFSFKMN